MLQQLKSHGVTNVFVGKDFCFGKDRNGTTHDIENFGLNVTAFDICTYNNLPVSTKNIRHHIESGHFQYDV